MSDDNEGYRLRDLVKFTMVTHNFPTSDGIEVIVEKRGSDWYVKVLRLGHLCGCHTSSDDDVWGINLMPQQIRRLKVMLKRYDVLGWKEEYMPSELILDGYWWDVELVFPEGVKKSGGQLVYPEQYLPFHRAFLHFVAETFM
jgi:hypothetical protein